MFDLSKYPVYDAARKLWEETQEKQIVKGLNKYDEPLNPDSWTFNELVDHALEESVDLVHYLTSLKVKYADLSKTMNMLRTQNVALQYEVSWLIQRLSQYEKNIGVPDHLKEDDTLPDYLKDIPKSTTWKK